MLKNTDRIPMTPEEVEGFLDWCFLTDPDVMEATLRPCIEDTGAADLCEAVSIELVRFFDNELDGRALDGRTAWTQWIGFPHAKYPYGEEFTYQYAKGMDHCICVVEGVDGVLYAVDFTARQFNDDEHNIEYPVPYVWLWE